MSPTRDPRRQQLARIHMAKKQMGLDEDTYRSLLKRVGGMDSSAKMTVAQRNAVIAEFVRLGFKEADKAARKVAFPGAPRNLADVPMLRKVEAILADAKRPWSYAHEMSKKMFHVNRCEWLQPNQLHSLVSALQIDANRRKSSGDH